MPDSSRAHRARRRASLAIAALIGAQLLAISRVPCPPRDSGLPLPRVACAPYLWPFLDYPMFAEAHREGEVVPRDTALALFAEGGELRLAPGDGGERPSSHDVVEALRTRDLAAVRRLGDELGARVGARVVELRLERELLVLTRAGFASRGREVLEVWRLDERGGPEPAR
jgi:hypothetical protein